MVFFHWEKGKNGLGNTCTGPGYLVYNNSLIMKATERYSVRKDEYPLCEGIEKRL